LNIHDRGHVLMGSSGARVVAATVQATIGNDAVVGPIQAHAPVFLRDRANTGDITTSSTVTLGNSDVTGTIHQGAFEKFEDFSIGLPFPVTFLSPVPQLIVGPNTSRTLSPGLWGDLSVYAGATLTLSDGLYVFHSVQFESSSNVVINGSGTWIFVATGSTVIIRGAINAAPGHLLFAAPTAQEINIGNTFNGTIVAPHAAVEIDMINGAVYSGAVFAQSMELFEGQFLQFSPFSGNWVPKCSGVNGFGVEFTGCH